MVDKIVGHATGRTITRRYAGLREHPAKNASQMIADEMMKAIKGEAKKQSQRQGGAGTWRWKPPKGGK